MVLHGLVAFYKENESLVAYLYCQNNVYGVLA